jgi:ATP synthase protein I
MPLDYKPEKLKSPAPANEKAKDVPNPAAIAMELPFVLVSAVVVGGMFGYLLDRWLHSKPVFLLLLGGLGFFAGVREILRRLPGNTDGPKSD